MSNLAEGERLLKSTQEMNQLAHAFQKDAHEMEIIQKNNNWWMCSKGCILTFAGAAGALFLLYLIATWAICGSPLCLG